ALQIARGLTLLPQGPARARPVMGDAGFERQAESLRVHVRDHQQRAVACVGDDGGDEAVAVEARRKHRAFLEAVFVRGRDGKIHDGGCPQAAKPRSILRNRACSSGCLKLPVSVVVRVVEPCLRMPRIAMHMCSASIITATPRGLSTDWMTSAICAVIASCVCRRWAKMSTVRAIFDR